MIDGKIENVFLASKSLDKEIKRLFGQTKKTFDVKRPWWQRLFISIKWPFIRLRARINHWLIGSCGMNCGYEKPYGFVPECGCPIHDE